MSISPKNKQIIDECIVAMLREYGLIPGADGLLVQVKNVSAIDIPIAREVPERMPRWYWMGYASEEHYRRSKYPMG